MFAATAAAEYAQKHNAHSCDVVVFEGTSKTMSKVRISGGGRVSRMKVIFVDYIIHEISRRLIDHLNILAMQCNGKCFTRYCLSYYL